MASEPGSGVAEDSKDYEDFPEGEPAARKSVEPDSDAAFADVRAVGEDALTLDASWLYKLNGHIFGPINSKAILEKLYAGEIDAETPLAPEDGEFMALRRYGAFRLHLPKAEEHRAAHAEKQRLESDQKRRITTKLVGIGGLALALLGGGGYGAMKWVESSRLEAAQRAKEAEEKKIRDQIDGLMANLTIEPPLIQIVDDEDPKKVDPKKRRGGSGPSRPSRAASANLPPTVELSREEVMEGVSEVFGGMKRCIVEQIQRDPESVTDKIVLSFAVNNQGVVQNVDIEDRTLRKSPLLGCIAGKLGTLHFRKYIGEVKNVEYPITIGGRR
ncbi:MAG: AgmX/PglI C-terminal domain-containing protein [Myxococcota bacterium]